MTLWKFQIDRMNIVAVAGPQAPSEIWSLLELSEVKFFCRSRDLVTWPFKTQQRISQAKCGKV